MNEVAYLLARLRKLYVNLNEHYVLKKRQIERVRNLFRVFFFPYAFGAEERIWLIQLASIMSWMQINTPSLIQVCVFGL